MHNVHNLLFFESYIYFYCMLNFIYFIYFWYFDIQCGQQSKNFIVQRDNASSLYI